MWQQWVNGILGLWIILMPFLNLSNDGTFTWTMIITGIAVAALAFWGATTHQNRHEHRQARESHR